MKENLARRVDYLHEDAMDLAEMAFFAKRRNEFYNYCKYIQKAFTYEKAAARLLENMREIEPTRSVLYQGAAYFAMNLGDFDEAAELIDQAEKGNPPETIRQELQKMKETLKREKRISKKVFTDASGYLEMENVNPPELSDIKKALDASITGSERFFGKETLEGLLNRIALEVKFESSNYVYSDRPQIFDKEELTTKWVDENAGRIEWNFWEAYKGYLTDKGFAASTLGRLDETTNDILNRLGNPSKPGTWDKRGMIVGDVQSGKTSNYVGLINKAADAGFRIIIVLSGLYENLRQQTQHRIDEGFTGKYSSTRRSGPIGVSPYRKHGHPPVHPITTTDDKGDLRSDSLRNYPLNTRDYYALVIKKNPTILKNLLTWLYNSSNAEQDGDFKIIRNIPLLIIDDEADYASINISKNFVSTINSYIRATLKLFEQSAFIGYTATPFANVFITDLNKTKDSSIEVDGMRFRLGEDLFPRDFIINVPAPSNYIGYSKVFATRLTDLKEDSGTKRDLPTINIIDDFEAYIPSRHTTKTELPDVVPPSMLRAVNCFLLVCAARRARGQAKSHNSMLIHVSWYVAWITRVYTLVEDYIEEVKNMIRYDEDGDFVDELKELWVSEFYGQSEEIMNELEYKDPQIMEHEWTEIRTCLGDAVEKIRVTAIHGQKKEAGNINQLNYADFPDGLSVIAVGGNKLSRGLTLEGLSISYFLRATRFYDTLLQMGRWFGYRPGYADLCRLFTTKEIITWYGYIGNATEDLKEQFDIMNLAERTPKNFGLKVKKAPGSLLMVSSAIKTRGAKDLSLSFSGQLLETYSISKSADQLSANLKATRLFIQRLGEVSGNVRQGQKFIWENVPAHLIDQFLQDYRTLQQNINPGYIRPYFASQVRKQNLINWTVVLIHNSRAGIIYSLGTENVEKIGLTERMEEVLENETGELYTDPVDYVIRNSHIVSPPHEYLDMDENDERYLKAISDWEQEKGPRRAMAYVPGKYIRKNRGEKNALLLVYMLDPTGYGGEKGDMPAVGYAISLPSIRTEDEEIVSYLANEQAIKELTEIFAIPADAIEDPENEDN